MESSLHYLPPPLVNVYSAGFLNYAKCLLFLTFSVVSAVENRGSKKPGWAIMAKSGSPEPSP
jgi:hypothetical protein